MRIEAVSRWILGILFNQLQVLVEGGDPPRSHTRGAAHHGDQKSALRKDMKLVGNRGERRIGRRKKFGRFGIRDIKEENLLLSFQDAQQATTSDDSPIAGKTNVMGLVAGRVRSGERCGGSDFAVVI